MSEVLDTRDDGRHTDVPEMIVRTFSAELSAGDGRTIDVRIVPYGEQAICADGLGGVARGVPYKEEWAPGVFAHQMNAANRVLVNVEHEGGVRGIVGHGLALREAADGFYGSMKIHETAGGETALILTREGVLGGISLEARPVKSIRTAEGAIRRVKAHLKAVALCRDPAYSGAQVLAVREQEAITLDEAMLPTPLDPALVERAQKLGIKIPDRRIARAATSAGAETLAIGALRDVIAALRRYINAEPDAADAALAREWMQAAERLLAKDMKENG